MTRAEIKAIVIDQITNHFSGVIPENLDDDTDFRDQLGMDSLDQAEAIMMVEQTFEINIPDPIARDIRTLGQLVIQVEKLFNQP
jgi:acyl carrier protein